MPLTHNFRLPIQLPFDWEYLLAFLRLRATPGVETVSETAYSRTIVVQGSSAVFSVAYEQASSNLLVHYSGNEDGRTLIQERVNAIFKPALNIRKIEAALACDAWLASFVLQQPGLRVPGGWSAFEVAVRAVLGQQVSVPAATTLMGRLVRMAGTERSLSRACSRAEKIR